MPVSDHCFESLAGQDVDELVGESKFVETRAHSAFVEPQNPVYRQRLQTKPADVNLISHAVVAAADAVVVGADVVADGAVVVVGSPKQSETAK